MALTLSTASAVLKDDYKSLYKQLNDRIFLLSQLEKNTDDVVGKRAVGAVHVSRSSGVGARGDGGSLPTAANQTYTQVSVPLRFNYGRIQISGPTIKAMASDRGAFIRATDSEMKRITADLKRDVNRQVWGTANGVIAQCGTTTTSTTVVLNATTTDTQVRQLYNDGGMVADIGTVATPTTIATARSVTAFAGSFGSYTVTISGATVSTTSAHFFFRTGSGGASSGTGLPGDGQNELTGMQAIVNNSGTLFTINPSTFPVWTSYVDSNSGTFRSVSESMVNKAIQQAEIKSGTTVNLLIGSPGVSRALAAQMQSMRRNIDNVQLKAGYKGLEWDVAMEGDQGSMQKALYWDQDCPANNLFGLSTDQGAMVEFVMSDWEWMEEDGAVLSRVAGADAYEATLFRYHEIFAPQRNAHLRIADLTEV